VLLLEVHILLSNNSDDDVCRYGKVPSLCEAPEHCNKNDRQVMTSKNTKVESDSDFNVSDCKSEIDKSYSLTRAKYVNKKEKLMLDIKSNTAIRVSI